MERQDIVVIGASAGGVEALTGLVSRLNDKVAASIFVVVQQKICGGFALTKS